MELKKLQEQKITERNRLADEAEEERLALEAEKAE